jgi:hypothetical protein
MDVTRSRKSILSHTFALPMIAAAVLVIAFLVYYFPVASRQEASLNDRAFRALGALSGQVQAKLESYRSILSQAERAPVSGKPTKSGGGSEGAVLAYLADQVPELSPAGQCQSGTHKDIGMMDTVVSGGGYSLRFYYHAGPVRDDLCPIDLSLQTLMTPLVAGAPGQLFDDIILADSRGRVLFQTRKTGGIVADLSGLFQRQKSEDDSASKEKTKATPATKGEVENRPSTFAVASNLASISFAGRKYRAYLVPLSLTLKPGGTLLANENQSGEAGGTHLVFCGIVEQGRLRTDSLAVSQTALITAVLALLLVMVGAWPWLKFTTMSATEEIPSRAGLTFVLTTLGAMVLLMMLLVHVGYLVGVTEVDRNLEALANAIDEHVGGELKTGLQMMDTVMSSRKFHDDAEKVHTFLPDDATCRTPTNAMPNPSINEASILTSTKIQFGTYPYFNVLFWTDKQGFQQIRYTVDQQKNPGLRVCDRPYFDAVIRDEVWYLKAEDNQEMRHRFRVDPLYSRQTGEYVAVVSESVPNRPGEPSLLRVASIVTPLLSLIHPVLPPDYGFAVVNQDGNVLFHSNSSKNGNENIFDESRGDSELRAAVFSRLGKHLTFDYTGFSHDAFITPFGTIQRCPWTLIVFSRLSTVSGRRIERIWIFAILALLYYVIFLLLSIFLVRSRDYPFPWMWPQFSRSGRYRHIALAVILIALPFAWLIFQTPSWDVLVAVILIPGATVAVVLLKLRSREREICWIAVGLWCVSFVPIVNGLENWWPWFLPASYICAGYVFLSLRTVTVWLSRSKGPSLPSSFASALLCVLILVGIMPCIAFFKVAYDCEQDLSTRRAQLLTVAALQQREQRVKRQYANVELSRNTQSGAAGIGKWLFQRRRLDQTLDRYDNIFVDQKIGQIFSPEYGMAFLRKAGSQEQRPPCERDPLEPLLRLSSWIPKSGSPLTRQFGEAHADKAEWSWCAEGINRLRLRCHSECSGQDSFASSPQTIALSRFVKKDRQYLAEDPVFELESLKPVQFLRKLGLILVGLIAGTFLWLRSTLRKIFLLDVRLGKPWPELSLLDDLPVSKDLILLRPVSSEETIALGESTDEFYSVNLATVAQDHTIDTDPITQPVIILNNFDIGLDNRVTGRRKRRLLEKLINATQNRKAVIIVSARDSQFYFESIDNSVGTKDREVEAWTNALAGFSLVCFREKPFSERESCYRALWLTSTWNERLALHQLAKTGWANHKNHATLRHLWLRGLIERCPMFKFADAGFRSFVLGLPASADQRQWRPGEASNLWEGLRIMFIVMFGGLVATVLFFNQQDILAFITSGISVFTPVSRLLADMRGAGKNKSEKA